MAEITVIDYEQLQAIAKKLDAEGEAIAVILASLRQQVFSMEQDWIGAGAQAFFDEMEMVVLPSLKRLSEALHYSSDAARKIIGIYQDSEYEAAAKFKSNAGSAKPGLTNYGGRQPGNLRPKTTGGNLDSIDGSTN